MEHPRHGAGVVTELMADGRTRVAYDNGEEHRYKPSSMHKLMRGDSVPEESIYYPPASHRPA